MVFASNDSVFALIAGSCALIFLAAAMSSFKRWTRRAYAFIPGPDSSSLAGYLLDLHNPDGLGWHYSMPEKYGHVARLKGGLFGRRVLWGWNWQPSASNSPELHAVELFPKSLT
ncbi:hypothetical protein B0H14DRAFT_2557683 [Mycena olivaceomarginata]|nr:hypothetical protein B0H14DRAFT_2557683 [Mycena olivaceomarginata]